MNSQHLTYNRRVALPYGGINLTSRLTVTTLFAWLLTTDLLQADDLRERLKDDNGAQTDLWVYNDIPTATEEARRLDKPLFVTFRCVPCKDCAAFDADVASGNDRIKALAKEKFVSVRQVEMKGVDLSLFEFDHDLNWAGMFINADGTVYARYGTQSAEGSEAYNSIDGLINTMNRVLELHANYPNNKPELVAKRGTKPPSTTLEMRGLRNPAKYAQETTRSNCIHCHNNGVKQSRCLSVQGRPPVGRLCWNHCFFSPPNSALGRPSKRSDYPSIAARNKSPITGRSTFRMPENCRSDSE